MKTGFCNLCGKHADPPRKLYCSDKCRKDGEKIVEAEFKIVKMQDEILDRTFGMVEKYRELLVMQETTGTITPENIKNITKWFKIYENSHENTRATT